MYKYLNLHKIHCLYDFKINNECEFKLCFQTETNQVIFYIEIKENDRLLCLKLDLANQTSNNIIEIKENDRLLYFKLDLADQTSNNILDNFYIYFFGAYLNKEPYYKKLKKELKNKEQDIIDILDGLIIMLNS